MFALAPVHGEFAVSFLESGLIAGRAPELFFGFCFFLQRTNSRKRYKAIVIANCNQIAFGYPPRIRHKTVILTTVFRIIFYPTLPLYWRRFPNAVASQNLASLNFHSRFPISCPFHFILKVPLPIFSNENKISTSGRTDEYLGDKQTLCLIYSQLLSGVDSGRQAMEFRILRDKNGFTAEQAAEFLDVTTKTVHRIETGETPPRKVYIAMLEARLAQRQKTSLPEKTDFTFIDLFAGIGGMRKGFQDAGGKCVFTSEWDKYAQTTYRANFPDDHEIAGDITAIDASDIPAHDVLLAGFPCQPFSLAGVSKKNSLGREHGFMDKAQGTLFFDVLRILKHHRPAAFLLENVKNLKSHNKGDTFATIAGALENELGYKISYRVIDGKGFVPQHRERIFIAGFREDTGFNFDHFEFPDPRQGPKLESILHSGDEEPEDPFTLTHADRRSNALSKVNPKYTLSDKLWTYLQNYAAKHKAQGNGFGFGLNGPEDTARTLSARYHKDGSEILIKQRGKNPRRLTPRECARLMGFDTDKNRPMTIPVSDTRAYKQFGNAVIVPVVAEIARCMKPHIMRITNPGELFQAKYKDTRVPVAAD